MRRDAKGRLNAIRAELERAWTLESKAAGLKTLPEHDIRTVYEHTQRGSIDESVGLEPWLSIIDEGIQCLASLTISMSNG